MEKGDIFYNKYGKYIVDDLLPNSKCIIFWEDFNQKNIVFRYNAKKGKVKPTLNGNEVKFKSGFFPSKSNGKHTVYYNVWMGIRKRCLNKDRRHPSYSDCIICDEWKDFQIFAKWYDENYKEGFNIDKDILIKGNKVYSPETCCVVPKEINLAVMNDKNRRGKYPIGMYFDKSNNAFQARISKYGIPTYLGSYNSTDEAFKVYKKAKEDYLKELANKYKENISEAVYNALINYKVEITD